MVLLKIFLTSFIFLLGFSNITKAQDYTTLELNYKEKAKLNIPESTEKRIIKANSITYNEDGEEDIDINDFSDDIDNEDELFKSKYGKTFTKFIDNKVINNKFSDIPSKLNQKPKF